MNNKRSKTFLISNRRYSFSRKSFEYYFKRCLDEPKASIEGINKVGDLEEYIAKHVICSKDTVHGWRFTNSGPGDLSIIEQVANILGVNDYMRLMKENLDENKTEKGEEKKIVKNELTNLQIESLKRIYDSVIEYLDEFEKTDGFTGTLWYEFYDNGFKNPEPEIYDYAEKKVEAVLFVIKKEYFYLHDTEVYDMICEYAENDLYEIFNGKLSYAYRFEAIPDGNPTTTDDYEKAISKLNEIIKEYI